MAALFDKAKQVAQQALDEAKKGVDAGQAKLDEVQAKREADRLLATLGAAYYAEQRTGGPRSDVEAALLSVDRHVQVNSFVGFPQQSAPGASPTPPAPSPGDAEPPTQPPPSSASEADAATEVPPIP